jgi:FkbM family methyltransferase
MLPELRIYTTPDDIKYLLFEQNEVISDEIRNHGIWNGACLDLAEKVLAKGHSGRVIDIGAGFGSFTLPLALKHYGYTYTAFEPQPTVNMQLNANIILNNLDNVRAYPYALGEKEELLDAPVLDVHRSSNHGSYSFDQRVNSMRGMVPHDQNDVFEFRTLDSFRFANVKLIKISTPGMEFKVLKGMHETLFNNNFPPVIFESWGMEWYKEEKVKVLDFFASRAYEHYVILGEHIMAFKTKAAHDYILTNGPSPELGKFTVLEQSHDTKSVLENQAALK